MRIWIDGDAMPNDVKEIVLRAAARTGVEAVLVANKPVATGGGPLVSFVLVEAGADKADGYIAEQSAPGDLAVTADVPLAARLVDKGVTAIDPRGHVYAEDTIGERLSVRDFMRDMRDAGLVMGGPPPFDRKAKQRFASTFDRLLTKALREAAAT